VGNRQALSDATSPRTHLEHTAFYAPLPIIALTCDDQIADFNLAAETLYGRHLDEYRAQRVADLLKEVCNRLPACFLPDDSGILNGQRGAGREPAADSQADIVDIDLPDYGEGKLRCWIADFIHPGNGEHQYRVLYTELIALRDMDRFIADLAAQWRHQLTWESYAISYDKILLKMGYYREVLSRHRSALSKPSIHHVIDLGAGTGNFSEMLLDGSQRQLTVVDSSRAMLERLRAKLSEHIGKNLVVIEQSAESLAQLDNGSFDGASILLALFDMSNPLAALSEAIRILRPGGVLVVTEPKCCFRKEPILEHIENELKETGLFAELEEDFKRVCNANQSIDPESRPSHSPLRAEDIYKILRDKGFQSLTITDSHFGNCATVCGIKA
jgi:ubiquinone/menaquinone biosynthesis C-methylase UbiE